MDDRRHGASVKLYLVWKGGLTHLFYSVSSVMPKKPILKANESSKPWNTTTLK